MFHGVVWTRLEVYFFFIRRKSSICFAVKSIFSGGPCFLFILFVTMGFKFPRAFVSPAISVTKSGPVKII